MGSFRREESSSWRRVGRSYSALVESEFVDSEVARVTSYQMLSQSMRFSIESQEEVVGRRPRKWKSFFRLFSFKKGDDRKRTPVAGEKKRRSSWLPDLNRRWPVQGW
ncbi:hypothetical protein M569_15904 [Genlisea aurea]|uniref:Uncharacterized protein n=1 Tax=Genlisea aurea TaxID=192259 RepID=S8BX43_9LAMI|nr:hypothetical protein M569_15904 [Genlisea aurea]